jgi:hypothetical protein
LTEKIIFDDPIIVTSKPANKKKPLISPIFKKTSVNEKIVKKKTIIYETCVDSTVIRIAGEKIKDKLFTRFFFLKPSPEDIEFISIRKCYEPFIVVSGKYSINYYRKCFYNVQIDKEVLDVVLFNQKFMPTKTFGSFSKRRQIIKLEGEERLENETKGSYVLDMCGKEVNLEMLPSAPSEKNPHNIISKFNLKVTDLGTDILFIRSKLFRRPKNIKRIVHELFEIDERAVIYVPRYEVKFKNKKTDKEKSVIFDGVTAKRI